MRIGGVIKGYGLLTKTGLVAAMVFGMTVQLAPQTQAPANCGPPHYCARSDRRVEPYPAHAPASLRAGFVLRDPNFGSRILRVTEPASDPQHLGQSFHSPSSGEQNPWNATTTQFYVGDGSGNLFLYDFDSSSMSVRGRGRLNADWRSEPQFSFTQPNILYGIATQRAVFQQYDLSTHKTTEVANPSRCTRLKSSDYGFDVSVSADDQRFAGVFGPRQDLSPLVYLYDRKRGCRWYNTETGEVGGQWGPAGKVTLPDRFTIHDARLAKSGDYIEIVAAGRADTGPYIWEAATVNVTPCLKGEVYQCLGHHALGYSHFINPTNRTHPADFVVRPLSDLKGVRHLVANLPPLLSLAEWFDDHVSWNYITPDDNTPACFSTYRLSNPTTPGAPLLVDGPWENEIDCVETDGKASTVWRFAHTYSSGKNGFWSTPRGNVSLDGRFYMFTSDWQGELGQGRDEKPRTDVFIVELR